MNEKWALFSVFEKKGIADFAHSLVSIGWKILASGGTANVLKEAGISVKDVSELVGGGAILGHRVVTLSREIHAGLLADLNDPTQIEEMKNLGLPIIDMVVCDFYPLEDAIAKPGATINTVIEATDIGGPCMVRSAAKGGRIVVCRLEDRKLILKELKKLGDVSSKTRQKMRARAEFEVASYVMKSALFHGQGQFEGRMNERKCYNLVIRYTDGFRCCIKDIPARQFLVCNFIGSEWECPYFQPEEETMIDYEFLRNLKESIHYKEDLE